jgi:hypothetical protein
MNRLVLTKKRAIMAILLLVILAVASFGFWDLNNNAQAAVIDPHPGLVGWWRFDEGTGTIAGDSSGNENNGNVFGAATWSNGMYGGALSFDGSSSYVNVPAASSLFPSNAITIEFWVNIASANINANAYMGFVATNSRTNGLQVIKNWGSGQVLFETPGVGNLLSNVALTPNTWNHVTCVLVSGSSAAIYINGHIAGSNSGWMLPTTVMDHWIGRAAQGTGIPYLNGAIDEPRIYNRALSSAEIQADFQSGPGFPSNVIAKVPKGTTQVITTLSWQGSGSINATITSPTQSYTEDTMQMYQKTTYSTSAGASGMLNIKRLSISVTALEADQKWTIELAFDSVADYQISVEVQK